MIDKRVRNVSNALEGISDSMTLMLGGIGCVKKIATNLAFLKVVQDGFKLIERAPGVSVEQIVDSTQGNLIVEGEIPEMKIF